MTQLRRFPPPWAVDRPYEDSFVVKDANGNRGGDGPSPWRPAKMVVRPL